MTDLEEFLHLRSTVANALVPDNRMQHDPATLLAAERLITSGVINTEQILKDHQTVLDARAQNDARMARKALRL